MHPIFNSTFIGLDWPVIFIGHLIMFTYTSLRLNWSWIPLSDTEKSFASKNNQKISKINYLENIYKKS